MASITWTEVVAIAPQLTAVGAGAQAEFTNYVNSALAILQYGGEDSFKLRMARLNLAAHLGEMWLRKGQASDVSSETVGVDSVATGYARLPQTLAGQTGLTSYGIEFDRLTSSTPSRLPMVNTRRGC